MTAVPHASYAVVQYIFGDGLVDVVHVVHIARALPIDLEHRPLRLILPFTLMLLVDFCSQCNRQATGIE